MYYIISLNNTYYRDEKITLWRPNNKGYTLFAEAAGLYDEIDEGYHNNYSCALPVLKEELDPLFVVNEAGRFLPSVPSVLRKLGLRKDKQQNCLVRTK